MNEHRGPARRRRQDDLPEGFSHAGRRAIALRGFFAVTSPAP
jgi:hypothetical protein